jgi:hypothetical protein
MVDGRGIVRVSVWRLYGRDIPIGVSIDDHIGHKYRKRKRLMLRCRMGWRWCDGFSMDILVADFIAFVLV